MRTKSKVWRKNTPDSAFPRTLLTSKHDLGEKGKKMYKMTL